MVRKNNKQHHKNLLDVLMKVQSQEFYWDIGRFWYYHKALQKNISKEDKKPLRSYLTTIQTSTIIKEKPSENTDGREDLLPYSVSCNDGKAVYCLFKIWLQKCYCSHWHYPYMLYYFHMVVILICNKDGVRCRTYIKQ